MISLRLPFLLAKITEEPKYLFFPTISIIFPGKPKDFQEINVLLIHSLILVLIPVINRETKKRKEEDNLCFFARGNCINYIIIE
jgi:hypothetical protein